LKVSNRTEAAMVFRNTTDQFPVNLRSLS
jgi:hypothetical protein